MLYGPTEMKPVFLSIYLEILYECFSGLGFICDVPNKTKGQPERKVETYSLRSGFPVQPALLNSASAK